MEEIISLPTTVFRKINSAVHSLAHKITKYFNAEDRRQQREKKLKTNELHQLLAKFATLDREHKDDINNDRALSRQLTQFTKNIVELFRHVSVKLGTCATSFFIRYCRRYSNAFHEIANPQYTQWVTDDYRQLIRNKIFNRKHQMYLMVQRIATHISFNQLNSVNKMV